MSDSRPTILIIDNDEGVVAALTARLEHLGYTCVGAGTGAAGMSMFREQPIDLVITDLNMPSGNGLDLVRTIRATSSVPIIVVTGFRDAFAAGLREFQNVTVLRKPYIPTELIDLVEADLVLSGRSLPIPPPKGKPSHNSRQGVNQWHRRRS